MKLPPGSASARSSGPGWRCASPNWNGNSTQEAHMLEPDREMLDKDDTDEATLEAGLSDGGE